MEDKKPSILKEYPEIENKPEIVLKVIMEPFELYLLKYFLINKYPQTTRQIREYTVNLLKKGREEKLSSYLNETKYNNQRFPSYARIRNILERFEKNGVLEKRVNGRNIIFYLNPEFYKRIENGN